MIETKKETTAHVPGRRIHWHTFQVVAKTLAYEVLIAFVAMGFLYATNFQLSVNPRVTVISPVGGGK